MTNLDQNMQTILETLKQKAANTSSIAELERLVLKASQDFARTAFESLASTQPASDSFLALQQHLTGLGRPLGPMPDVPETR
jgi:hypothetical protein